MTKTLKARFYRITASNDEGEQVNIPALDWKMLLAHEGIRSLKDRPIHMDGNEYVFEPRPTGERHLAVHKLKAGEEYISRMDSSGNFTEVMAVDEEGNRLADTSCAVFRRGSNVFGLVTANQSAPRAGRIADWITRRDPSGDQLNYHAVPLRLESLATQKAERAEGATSFDITVPVSELKALGISVSADAEELASELPGAMVTLKVSYGRRRPRASEGGRMLRLVKKIADGITGDDRAKARIYQEVPSKAKGKAAKKKTRLEGELVDLVQHEIAHEFQLSAVDGEVRIDGTLNAIDNGFALRASELRRALGEVDDVEGEDKG